MLLDIHLPRWGRLTVCRKLKSAPETYLIPVLMTTGDSVQHSHLNAIEAGADDFLPKPLALPELRARALCEPHEGYIDELDNAAASIVMLGATIEARDVRTNGHCQRLSDWRCCGTKRGPAIVAGTCIAATLRRPQLLVDAHHTDSIRLHSRCVPRNFYRRKTRHAYD